MKLQFGVIFKYLLGFLKGKNYKLSFLGVCRVKSSRMAQKSCLFKKKSNFCPTIMILLLGQNQAAIWGHFQIFTWIFKR